MRGINKRIILLFLCITCLNTVEAKVLKRSEKTPEWAQKGEASLNNRRSNDSYFFKIIEISGTDLAMLRNEKVGQLSTFIGQYNQISAQATTNINTVATERGVSGTETYAISYTNNSRTDVFHARFVDEYWEYVSYPDGSRGYEYYALFAVSRNPAPPVYDDFSFTTSYGARGLVRSIIPGWGQIYKGSTAKGACILAGEAVCVAGIIVCENQRASYHKKMKEQPRFAQTYNTKSDNWENGRNICIGAAAALYVYNLIDAVAAKGSKRVVVKKARPQFAFYPVADMQHTGVALSLNF